MIKGCERRIIYIRDTESPIFKEAYFILRDGASPKRKDDMVAEAMRIIRERSVGSPSEKKRRKTLSPRPFVHRRVREAVRLQGNIYETEHIPSPFVLGVLSGIGVFALGLFITMLIV